MTDERTDVTPLHWAAQEGDLKEVRRLVDEGANVNVQDDNGNTPLKYASAEPLPDMLRLLISLGADVNLGDHRGFTPMHCVAGHGVYKEALEMAEILIQAGADVNCRSIEFGFVPLHDAFNVRMIDWLLKHGANPTIRSDAGQTPAEHMQEEEYFTQAKHLRRKMREMKTG